MPTYIAVLVEGREGEIEVVLPDFPNCITFGETPDQAKSRAAEALRLYLLDLRKRGIPPPHASAQSAGLSHPDGHALLEFFYLECHSKESDGDFSVVVLGCDS